MCSMSCCNKTMSVWSTEKKNSICLQIIENDIMYRNHDMIAPSKSKAIQKLVAKLCDELRSVAGLCIDSFAIPDAILRAPIGTSTFTSSSDSHIYDEYLRSAGFDLSDLIWSGALSWRRLRLSYPTTRIASRHHPAWAWWAHWNSQAPLTRTCSTMFSARWSLVSESIWCRLLLQWDGDHASMENIFH